MFFASAGSRVLVERSVYDKVAASLQAYFARMRAGSTTTVRASVSPCVSAAAVLVSAADEARDLRKPTKSGDVELF